MKPTRPGRPSGRSEKGHARQALLYETALRLFATQGYEATTLRQIAQEAGVSPGLMYRYFDGKQAVVIRLYTELSTTYAQRVAMAPTPWSVGVAEALTESLTVLGPHRGVLRALMGVLVSPKEEGLFGSATIDARHRVMAAFERAVLQATDAPTPAVGQPLARLCYLGHLAVILFWLLDRSPEQSATTQLVGGIERNLGRMRWVLRLPGVGSALAAVDRVVWHGLLGAEGGDGV